VHPIVAHAAALKIKNCSNLIIVFLLVQKSLASLDPYSTTRLTTQTPPFPRGPFKTLLRPQRTFAKKVIAPYQIRKPSEVR
jgi:hypothetical protein